MNRVQREERMQRIRIGLTGLAFVFLLVLLGTAISRSSGDSMGAPVQNELAEPSEPLAEIGAAPSMPQENESEQAAAAKKP
jgi:hypothetical protein